MGSAVTFLKVEVCPGVPVRLRFDALRQQPSSLVIATNNVHAPPHGGWASEAIPKPSKRSEGAAKIYLRAPRDRHVAALLAMTQRSRASIKLRARAFDYVGPLRDFSAHELGELLRRA